MGDKKTFRVQYLYRDTKIDKIQSLNSFGLRIGDVGLATDDEHIASVIGDYFKLLAEEIKEHKAKQRENKNE